MPDVYVTIEQADVAVQEQLAKVLELRAADPQQRAMLEDYLADLSPPDGARVLEVGCGTGAVSRAIAELLPVREVVGVDPSPVFIERAQAASESPAVSFERGDARRLRFEDGAFDAVVFHTALCHIPGPQSVLAEAARVTAADGRLAVFDGDYVTTTVATYDSDPLQACVDAAVGSLVYDPLLVRRLPALAREAGWNVERLRSHGYVETDSPAYTLTLIDRGADTLAADGRLGAEAAEALKAEARRRAAAGTYFGHIAYASLIARRG